MTASLMILGGILNVLAKLGEYLVPPITRQFKYVCCYGENIADLQNEVEKLLRTDAGVRIQVDAARSNLEQIAPDVEHWLGEVEKIKDETHKLQSGAANVSEVCIHGGCMGLKSRYQLSKKAKKIIKKVIALQQEGKFRQVSYPVPFREMQSLPVESGNMFGTRKLVEDSIISTLQDSDVKMIGLCGMGGVGKTTMARRIAKLLKEKSIFDEIVMAVVSRHPDQRRIQTEIAEMLNLDLVSGSEWNRGNILRSRILDASKILVILDDIWGSLDLDTLGIPLTASDITCKILLTSRARDVCVQMGADKVIELQVLSEEEAWILFSMEAGLSSSRPGLYPIAKDVANECKGLPLALVSVARALKQKSDHTWENALVQLRCSIPTNLLGVLNDVYRPLELSYLALESNEAKELFLFCSSFRERTEISIENLVRYGVGLDMFKGINNIREARIRTHALIEGLKDRFLLLDGHREGFVKMHDVIRDVAVSIASKEKPRFLIDDDSTRMLSRRCSYEHCTHISLFSNLEYIPEEIDFPNLVFLLWESPDGKGTVETIEKWTTLNVLDLRYINIPAGPSSIQNLKNIRSLILYSCRFENLSIIGQLINLEILIIQSTEMQIFPAALGKLANLKLLDLTDCENLREIEQGAIGGLVKLEELHLTMKFPVGGALLAELERLPNLTTLRICIEEIDVELGNINLCSELKEYDISIWTIYVLWTPFHPLRAIFPIKYELPFQKVMNLFLVQETNLGEWIGSLLERSDDLRLKGDGTNNILKTLGSTSFQHLRQLCVEHCSTVKYLINGNTGNLCAFPILEILYLREVSHINEICSGQLPERSFGELQYLHLEELNELKHFSSEPREDFRLSNLRSIYICRCRNLKSLFSNSVARSLLQLEELVIEDCPELATIFFNEHSDTTNYMELPRLDKLVLRCLHSLEEFGAGQERISFPQLRILKMDDMHKFKGFCPEKTSSFSGDEYLLMLFNEKVHCPRIKTLSLRRMGRIEEVFCHKLPSCVVQELEFMEVEACARLRTMFSSSIAQGLVKLKKLLILRCGMLIKVIANQQAAQQNAKTLPLGSSNCAALLHQLEYLEVTDCGSLETLFTPSIARNLVKLKDLQVRGCNKLEEVIEKEDARDQVNTNANPIFPQLMFLEQPRSPQNHSTQFKSCQSYICEEITRSAR